MKVFVHRNLHIQGHSYSIMSLEKPLKHRVIGYATGILIENAKLEVNETGRQRVLKKRCKNVHAGVVGELVAVCNYQPRIEISGLFDTVKKIDPKNWAREIPVGLNINYNPYKGPKFYYEDNPDRFVMSAPYVQIFNERVQVLLDTKKHKFSLEENK